MDTTDKLLQATFNLLSSKIKDKFKDLTVKIDNISQKAPEELQKKWE